MEKRVGRKVFDRNWERLQVTAEASPLSGYVLIPGLMGACLAQAWDAPWWGCLVGAAIVIGVGVLNREPRPAQVLTVTAERIELDSVMWDRRWPTRDLVRVDLREAWYGWRLVLVYRSKERTLGFQGTEAELREVGAAMSRHLGLGRRSS
jgi:hypothetical protein